MSDTSRNDGGEDATLPETCQRCGNGYFCWWAPVDLFDQVRGDFTLLCPSCFDEMSTKRLCWVPYLLEVTDEAIALDTERAILEWQTRSRDAIAASKATAADGADLIAIERRRQVEGWTAEHDDEHDVYELTSAAAAYIFAAQFEHDRPDLYGDGSKTPPPEGSWAAWPWDASWWKPTGDPVRTLVKAGALIAAEIDRLQRALDIDGQGASDG